MIVIEINKREQNCVELKHGFNGEKNIESKPITVNCISASSRQGFTSSTKILVAHFFPPNGFTNSNSLFGLPVTKIKIVTINNSNYKT